MTRGKSLRCALAILWLWMASSAPAAAQDRLPFFALFGGAGGDPQTVLPDIREALADQARLRGLIYEALGKTPDNAPPVNPQPPAASSKFIPPRKK